MSYFDDASLVMIPSGYKEDKVYSVKPIDGSGDLDFTRASSATRIGPTGLIEKTRTNELSYSYEFDNVYWNIDGVSATANTIANPLNNAVNADTLTTTALGSGIEYRLRATTTMSTSRVYSYSVYVKKIDHDYFYLRTLPNNAFTIFDIQNGTIPTKSGGHFDAQIENIGSGWYRCSVSFVTPSSFANNLVDLGFSFSDTSFSGSVPTGRQMYWYGVQLEESLVATSYIETTSTTVSVGSYDNVPRLNYTAGSTSSCPSLLLEPQRTNVLLHSEYFDSYTQFGSDITQNSLTSPEGVTNASTFIGDGSQNQIYLSTAITLSSGGNFTVSIFAKTGTNNFLELGFEGFSTSTLSVGVFNLTSGTATGTGTSMESYGNGWYRCILTQDIDSGDLAGAISMRVRPESSLFWPSASDANGKSVYLYGAQVEEGSYPSSYIPTFGATVTRVADACSKTGVSSLIGQTEGTLFIEAENNPSAYLFASPNNVIFGSINSGNYLNNFHFTTDASKIYVYCNSGGTLYASPGATLPSSSTLKMAVTYTSSAIKFFLNGVLVGTDTSFSLPVGMNQIDVGHMGGQAATQKMRGGIDKFIVFTEAITDAEAITLTTI